MSEFLSNLAARSLGTLETIRPRVPFRFEPPRRPDGLLAGRTSPGSEGLEDNPELEVAGGDEASAVMAPVEPRPHVARPAEPMDLSPRLPSPSLVSARSAPETAATRPAVSSAPRAASAKTPPAPGETVFPARALPRSENDGSLTPTRRAVTDTGTPRLQNAGSVSRLEPTEAWTGQPVEPEIKETRTAQSLGPSNASALVNERPGPTTFRAASTAVVKSEIEPHLPSLPATGRGRNDEAQTAQSQPKRPMPMPLEPALPGGLFPDGSRSESGPESDRIRAQIRTGDALKLTPDFPIRPAPGQETAIPAIGAELASAATRAAAPNLPPALPLLPDAVPEPEIRVTIGRVEVRAVFPEQPVKHSAAPRFRPSVTLDDYLNRGGGAKR
jgi:hypothetical protein